MRPPNLMDEDFSYIRSLSMNDIFSETQDNIENTNYLDINKI